MEFPLPYGSFDSWAIWAAYLMEVAVNVPMPPSEAEWETWGRAFIDVPELRKYNLPGPISGESWADWANRARLAFPGA